MTEKFSRPWTTFKPPKINTWQLRHKKIVIQWRSITISITIRHWTGITISITISVTITITISNKYNHIDFELDIDNYNLTMAIAMPLLMWMNDYHTDTS